MSRNIISEVTIHRFRSIEHIKCTMGNYSLLIGSNNAGKSNFLDAVRYFFDDYSYNTMTDFPKWAQSSAQENYVEVSFHKRNGLVLEEWGKHTKGRKVRVRRILSEEISKRRYVLVDAAGLQIKGAKELKKLPSALSCHVTYIPSIGKPLEELRLTGSSVLKKLIEVAFGDRLEMSAEYGELQRAIKEFSQKIQDDDNSGRFVLRNILASVNESIKSWGSRVVMSFDDKSADNLIKNLFQTHIIDEINNCEIDLNHFGSGFQRNLIFQLLKVYSKFQHPESAEDCPKLLLFEEPEVFLHPDQQEELSLALNEMSKGNWQVLCSTHSPYFVGSRMNEVTSIIRLSRTGALTVSYQLDEEDMQEIYSENANYPHYLGPYIESITTDLDSFRYALLMRTNRAALFFAKYVFLVEGATDEALVTQLRKDGKLNLPVGTVVVDCLGKFNMHRFMIFLRKYGIPFVVMHDDDRYKEGDQKKKQEAWNHFVREKVKDYGAKVIALEGDLESFLVVDKSANRTDVKPYHLLARYNELCAKKDVKFQERLEELCELIEEAFKHQTM